MRDCLVPEEAPCSMQLVTVHTEHTFKISGSQESVSKSVLTSNMHSESERDKASLFQYNEVRVFVRLIATIQTTEGRGGT